jgi:ATP-dependent Clp protease ATP-binding subunit ClpC
MEEGRLTDSFGRQVDFRNVILIMTSNLGSQQMKSGTRLGFDRLGGSQRPSEDERQKRMKADVMIEVERYFRPEFLNRVDELIVFNPLSHEDLQRIVHLQLNDVRKRLTEKGVKLELDQVAIDFLIAKGYSDDYGARPLRRAIERFIEDPLAEHLLRSSHTSGQPVQVHVAENGETLTFDQKPVAEPVPTAAAPQS